jgi:hypothetical protein
LRQETTRRQAFEIQSEAVTLSLRRVDSSRLNLEAGNAQTRDLLESQAALVQAQNARTSALVDYRLAQLALLRDTDLLALDQDGFAILGIDAAPSAGTSVQTLVPGAPWGLAPAEEDPSNVISAQAASPGALPDAG